MIFLHFFVILLIATLAMKYIVLPVFALLLFGPSALLSRQFPRVAVMLGSTGAVVGWIVNLTWFAYISYLVRGFSHGSSWLLTPIYIIFGLGAATAILSPKPEDVGFKTFWTVVFIMILCLSFIFMHPVFRS